MSDTLNINIYHNDKPYYRTPRGILRQLFIQEFPNGDLDKFEKVVCKYKDEEIDRVVDGAMRFGLAAMMDALQWKEPKHVRVFTQPEGCE